MSDGLPERSHPVSVEPERLRRIGLAHECGIQRDALP
jgi:hypothetical protein